MKRLGMFVGAGALALGVALSASAALAWTPPSVGSSFDKGIYQSIFAAAIDTSPALGLGVYGTGKIQQLAISIYKDTVDDTGAITSDVLASLAAQPSGAGKTRATDLGLDHLVAALGVDKQKDLGLSASSWAVVMTLASAADHNKAIQKTQPEVVAALGGPKTEFGFLPRSSVVGHSSIFSAT